VLAARVSALLMAANLSLLATTDEVANVRFWHKADIPTRSINVRFWGVMRTFL
jgi:hypothetical protein